VAVDACSVTEGEVATGPLAAEDVRQPERTGRGRA
jgi:hypothetical protein